MKLNSIITICLLLITFPLLAQPSLPSPPSAPVDGGFSLLIASGIGYGFKRIARKNKN